ncbi:hypothetical protein NW766_005935 [Fusarium irregulare]|uniref:Uncharacterized protein n=1 Tax=Fusarium irregulare TaxID=2494466 RepID=A0A9W8PQN5_9HYPO|nr:hypothetical protein NW766_005935 [Fusarium irregulare]
MHYADLEQARGVYIVPLGERFCRIPLDPGNPQGRLCYNDKCFSGTHNLREHMEKVHHNVHVEKVHLGSSTTKEMMEAQVRQLNGLDKDKAPPATPSKAAK